MKPRSIPVWKLAKQAGVDVDTVLLVTWDLVHVDGRAYHVRCPTDKVPSTLVDGIRKSLGLATQRELQNISYWTRRLNMTKVDLVKLLSDKDYPFRLNQKKLPPKAQKFLENWSHNQNITPLTEITKFSTTQSLNSFMEHNKNSSLPPCFDQIGKHRTLRWLTVDETYKIHNALVDDFARSPDPIEPPGARGNHMIESAVFRPQTSLGEVLKYPTIETSDAALLCALIHDHPFHNGNKRTALVCTLVFLDENGLVLTCTEDELFRFVLSISKHKILENSRKYSSDYETFEVAKKISKWSRSVSKSEHQMTFMKLRGILESYGCKVKIRSNQAIITRNINNRSRLLVFPNRNLKTKIHYQGSGREISPNTIKKIRKELQLDHEHGYDESDFYDKKPLKIDDFIAKYRKTLTRLAKL